MTDRDRAPRERASGGESGAPGLAARKGIGQDSGSTASIGHHAPDFEAQAYSDGGFTRVRLSDYRGRWVVLCFYVGDFTFV